MQLAGAHRELIHESRFASKTPPEAPQEKNMNLCGPKQLAGSIAQFGETQCLSPDTSMKMTTCSARPRTAAPVAEIVAHIAYLSRVDRFIHEEERVTTLDRSDLGKLLKESESEEKKPYTKSRLVDCLPESGESWAQWVELLPESLLTEGVAQRDGTMKTRFEMILGTKEHEIHHRGQLTVVERMLGIVPHLTRRQP